MDYPKLISEKWNLTAKFNCLQAIYFDAPSALAVPMCELHMHTRSNKLQFDLSYPASLYPDLSIIRTRSRRDFFLCVYTNYGEKGDFKSIYNKMI